MSQPFNRLSQGNIQSSFNRVDLFKTNSLQFMTPKQAKISSCCWREVSRKRGSHSLILHIVLQSTIEPTPASFNYLNVHCKEEQLNATVFNPSVTAITNNLSEWRWKNNKSHISRPRKNTARSPLFVPIVGSNI